MALSSLVRTAVAIGDRVSKDLQVDIVHQANGSPDGRGKVIAVGAPVTRKGLWEPSVRTIRKQDGTEALSQGKVTLLSNVTVGQWDRLTVPGDIQGPVLQTKGFGDPVSGSYYIEIWIG